MHNCIFASEPKRRSTMKLALFCLLSALVSSACFSSRDACPPPNRKNVGAEARAQSGQPASSATANELVVYLDTSSPMKGYVLPDGQSVFSRTLRTLREFVTTLETQPRVYLRTVDSRVGEPQSDSKLDYASTNQGFYTGGESNLAAAIGVFARGLRAPSAVKPTDGAAPAASGKAEVPPRFHVLVTDGVQFTQSTAHDSTCASGADAYCVRKRLLELLGHGWGGAVIGLRSEYCCAFFSESAQRPVPYDTRKREAKDLRPFYLYVFSPDPAALNSFVARLKESLRKANGRTPPVIRELPITAAYAEGAPGWGNTSFQTADKTKLSGSKLNGVEGEPLYLSLRLRTDSKAVNAPFSLTLKPNWSQPALDSGNPQELAGLLRWELLPVYPQSATAAVSPDASPAPSTTRAPPAQAKPPTGARYPELKFDLKNPSVTEQGAVVFKAAAEWPLAAGTPCWRAYRLVGRLNADAEPPWVREWSTDRDVTSATGNRTLNLTSALLGLWRNPVLQEQVVVEAYLRVGPQN